MGQEQERRERFEALAEQVWMPIPRYLCRRVNPGDVDDVLAEVLLVLWRRLDDVPTANPLPWSYAVARGCLGNHLRGQHRQLRLLQRMREQPQAVVAQPDDRVTRALARLRPQDAEVLRLWAWEGLEAVDIGKVLQLSPNASAARLSRARAALRRELGQDDATAGHKQLRDGKTGRS